MSSNRCIIRQLLYEASEIDSFPLLKPRNKNPGNEDDNVTPHSHRHQDKTVNDPTQSTLQWRQRMDPIRADVKVFEQIQQKHGAQLLELFAKARESAVAQDRTEFRTTCSKMSAASLLSLLQKVNDFQQRQQRQECASAPDSDEDDDDDDDDEGDDDDDDDNTDNFDTTTTTSNTNADHYEDDTIGDSAVDAAIINEEIKRNEQVVEMTFPLPRAEVTTHPPSRPTAGPPKHLLAIPPELTLVPPRSVEITAVTAQTPIVKTSSRVHPENAGVPDDNKANTKPAPATQRPPKPYRVTFGPNQKHSIPRLDGKAKKKYAELWWKKAEMKAMRRECAETVHSYCASAEGWEYIESISRLLNDPDCPADADLNMIQQHYVCRGLERHICDELMDLQLMHRMCVLQTQEELYETTLLQERLDAMAQASLETSGMCQQLAVKLALMDRQQVETV